MQLFNKQIEEFTGTKTESLIILDDKRNAELLVTSMINEQKRILSNNPMTPNAKIIEKSVKKRIKNFILEIKRQEGIHNHD